MRKILMLIMFIFSISFINAAYIDGVKTSLVDANGNSITVELPEYEQGDLLVFVVAKDTTTGGTFTIDQPAWTKLDGVDYTSTSVRSAVYYLENATAGLSDPVVSSTDTDTWNALAVSIKNYDETNSIDVSSVVTGSFVDNELTFQSVTTSSKDSLVLYFLATDGAADAYAVDENRLLSYDNGVAVNTLGFYENKIIAGATDEKLVLSSSNEEIVKYVIAINDDGQGYNLPAIEGGFNNETLFNAFNRFETDSYLPSGVVTDLSGSIFQYLEEEVPTIAGIGVKRVDSIIDQVDASTVPYVRAMRLEADRDALNLGIIAYLDKSGNNQTYDFSEDGDYLFLTAHTLNAKTASVGAKVDDRGFGVGIMDNNGNYKIFKSGGRDASLPFSSADGGQIIVDPKSDFAIMQENGTIDYSNIDRIIFVQNAQLGNNYNRFISGLFKGSEYNLFGGSSSLSSGLIDISEYNKRLNLKTTIKTGNIINIDVSVLFGKVSVDSYFNASGETIIFGGTTNGRHLTPYTYGFTFNNTQNDIIDLSSSTVLSDNPYKLNTLNNLGTIDFSSSSITKCSLCIFRNNTDLTNSIITPETNFSVESYGATLDGLTVNGELKVYQVDDLTDVTSDFLYLNTSGTYTFTNSQFTNLTLNHTGNMTINLINTPQPSVNNIGSGSIVFKRPVNIEITGLVGTETVRIFNEDSGETLFNDTLTNSTFILETNYVGDQQLIIDVREDRKIPQNFNVTLKDNGLSLTLSLSEDLIYEQMGVNGSTVTGLSIQKSPLRILINESSNDTTLQKIYTWWVFETSKPEYMDVNPESFRALTSVEVKSFNDLKLKNINSDALTITGGNIQYDGGIASEIVDAGGSIIVVSSTVVSFSSGESLCIQKIDELSVTVESQSANIGFIKKLLLLLV